MQLIKRRFFTIAAIFTISILSISAQSGFLLSGGSLENNSTELGYTIGQSILAFEQIGFSPEKQVEKRTESNIILVELLAFDVEVISSQEVLVSWNTAMEYENAYFNIERSSNGKDWEVIGKLKGKGTTFEESSYIYLDRDPLIGKSNYRLAQVNFDNQSAYSNAEFIHIHNDDFQIFPNPTRDKLFLFVTNFSLKSNFNYQITDVVGNVKFKGSLEMIETEIDVSDLIPGTYLIQIFTQERYRKPLVFVKTM